MRYASSKRCIISSYSASVFKNLHSRAFLVTAFTGYVWREAKLEKKPAVFEKKKKQNKTKQTRIRVDGALDYIRPMMAL